MLCGVVWKWKQAFFFFKTIFWAYYLLFLFYSVVLQMKRINISGTYVCK